MKVGNRNRTAFDVQPKVLPVFALFSLPPKQNTEDNLLELFFLAAETRLTGASHEMRGRRVDCSLVGFIFSGFFGKTENAEVPLQSVSVSARNFR